MREREGLLNSTARHVRRRDVYRRTEQAILASDGSKTPLILGARPWRHVIITARATPVRAPRLNS